MERKRRVMGYGLLVSGQKPVFPSPMTHHLITRRQGFSSISHMPQGQTPAQKPQPMQRLASTTYS